MSEPKVARSAEERGQGICRTCLARIWNEGGTVGHRKRDEGWSDRIERGGDSLVCFKAREYRHVPLAGREAEIYDVALSRREPVTAAESILSALRALIDHPKDAAYPIVSRDDVRAILNGHDDPSLEGDSDERDPAEDPKYWLEP
jgi:hypothetical protein